MLRMLIINYKNHQQPRGSRYFFGKTFVEEEGRLKASMSATDPPRLVSAQSVALVS